MSGAYFIKQQLKKNTGGLVQFYKLNPTIVQNPEKNTTTIIRYLLFTAKIIKGWVSCSLGSIVIKIVGREVFQW